MNNIIRRKWNRNSITNIEDLRGAIFQAEEAGHTFEISGVDSDGNTVALSGTPSGVMLRPDNTDVALDCAVSGGVVTATLPAECYDVQGRFGITIYLTSDEQKTAIYAAVGSVARTSSGNASPETTASVVDLINAIEAAIAEIPASDTNLKGALAPTYSTSAVYAVGSYAWYDGKLYKCITAITSGETWTAAHWTDAKLASDVSDLKSALGCETIKLTSGGFIQTNGTSTTFQPNTAYPSYGSAVIDCNENDLFCIKASGTAAARPWAFAKADGTILTRTDASTNASDFEGIVAPKDAKKLVINSANPNHVSYKVVNWQAFTRYAAKAKNEVSAVMTALTNYETEINGYIKNEQISLTSGGYIDAKNKAVISFTPVSSTFGYTVIDCEPFDMFIVRAAGNTNVLPFAFTDETGKTVGTATKNAYSNEPVLAPKDAKKMVINSANANYKSYRVLNYGAFLLLADCMNNNTEKMLITKSENLLDPTNLRNTTYKYDPSDGETHVDVAHGMLTVKKINTGLIERLYFRKSASITSNLLVFVYCYKADGTHISNKQTHMDDIGDATFTMTMPSGTEAINIFIENTIDPKDLTVSVVTLPSVTAYNPQTNIKEEWMPLSGAKLKGKTIVCFGDSIFGGKRPPNGVPDAIADLTGATAYNAGFGGCWMSKHASALTDWDLFDMYKLADSIYAGNFDAQAAVDIEHTTDMPSYFRTTVNMLQAIDFSKVDIITIAYGTNDFFYEVPTDNPNNPLDVLTLCGALRYSLEKIWSAYPQIRIFVCTPIFRLWFDGDVVTDSDHKVIGDQKLTDYVAGIKSVCEGYHIPCINNYDGLGLNIKNYPYYYAREDGQGYDGTHPSRNGTLLIAQHIANELF